MTTKPRTPTTAKPTIKAVKAARKATKATTPATPPVVVRFPNEVLVYLSVAVEGPLGPGGIAHRIVRYPVTRIDHRGYRHVDHLIGAACGATTTRPGPDHDTDPDETETVPVVVCRDHSASFAQHHGVTRCTHDACWPLRPSETTRGGAR